MDDEGEKSFELVSKLDDQFGKLGISLIGTDGQLKSSFDILSELNTVWGKLDKNTRVYIAELVAGKNQVDVFNALMSNFNSVLGANETAMNSAGSAAKENAAYMESLEAKTNAVKEAFQRLANSIVDNELVGLLLDMAKGLLEIANTPVGKFALVATGITAVTIAVKGLMGAVKLGTALMSAFAPAAVGAGGALGALAGGPLALLIAGLSLLITFAPQIIDFFDGVINPVEHFTEKINENNEALKTNKEKLEEINKIPWYERTSEINAEAEALVKLNDELERNNEENRKKLGQGAKDQLDLGEGEYGYKSQATEFEYTPLQNGLSWDEVDLLGIIQQETGKVYESAQEAIDAGEQIVATYEYVALTAEEYYQNMIADQEALNKKVRDGIELGPEENARWVNNNNTLATYAFNAKIAVENGEELEEVQSQIAEKAASANESFTKLNENLIEQDRVARIAADGLEITEEEAQKLITINKDLAVNIGKLNDKFYLERTALYDLARAGNETAQQMVKDQKDRTLANIKAAEDNIKIYETEAEAYRKMVASLPTLSGQMLEGMPQGIKNTMNALSSFQSKGAKAALDLAEQKALLAELEKEMGSWVVPSALGTGGKTSDKTKKPDILEATKQSLKEVEHQIFLMAQQDAEKNSDAIVAKYKEMQQIVHKKAEELRKLGYADTSDEIMELQKLYWNYAGEIDKVYQSIEDAAKKALEEQEKAVQEALKKIADAYQKEADKQKALMDEEQSKADAYKLYAQMMSDYLQEQINGYQAEIDAIEKANEERENEIALQEKINALAKAQSKQVMVFKDGKFQYVQDSAAVSEAASDLAEFKRQQDLAKEKQYWQDKIDATNKYKQEWDDFTKEYDKQANIQILIQSNLFTQEDLTFKKRIGSAESFATEYEAIMKRVIAAQEAMDAAQAEADKYAGAASGGSSGTSPDWSQLWHETDDPNLKDYYHQKKQEEMAGSGKTFDPSTGRWYANGTTYASGGISMVGEKGPEMRVLNSGDGIIPADITKNLWALGTNPMKYLMNIGKNMGNMGGTTNLYQFDIGSLLLPNVTDAQSLLAGLKNMAYQRVLERT